MMLIPPVNPTMAKSNSLVKFVFNRSLTGVEINEIEHAMNRQVDIINDLDLPLKEAAEKANSNAARALMGKRH